MSNIFSFILDNPVSPLSLTDSHSVKRARDTLSNDVIIEIIDENTDAEVSFRNSLRYQIVDSCSRLRATLITIDQLMDHFNNSIAKTSSSASVSN